MDHLKYTLLGVLYLICFHPVFSQTNNSNIPSSLQDEIEFFLENLDDESDFDFNTITEILQSRLENPLNINEAESDDLSTLLILTDLQINALLSYRKSVGPLIDIHELQAIPYWDLRIIRNILPFITITKKAPSPSKIKQMLREGKNEWYARWSKILETKRGYRSDTPNYIGSPDKLYLRYRHSYYHQMSLGITMEKDPGEAFFDRTNPYGFDFYSMHLYLKDPYPRVRSLVIGDYSISMGQGLIMHSGFGRGKSSLVTSIKKGGQTIHPYTSVNETNFLRGIGLEYSLKPVTITIFASSKKVDANTNIDNNGKLTSFSSLPLSGLHRTDSEIDNKNRIRHHITGVSTKYAHNNFSLSTNFLVNQFNASLERNVKPYNTYYFEGSSIYNASIDYSYAWRNFLIFGESAVSDGGGMAVINGVMTGLSSHIDLALLYRNIDRTYQALQGNALLESTTVNNEKGIYIGTEIKLSGDLTLGAYYDTWKHPWLSFTADAPSYGTEYFTRLTYYKRRKTNIYIQFRREIKGINTSHKSNAAKLISSRLRTNTRIQFNYKISSNLEWRNRIEFSTVRSNEEVSRGMMIYQDLIFRNISSPLSFSTRLAYFQTDDYASRIYAYENDLLYQFSIPAYYGQGLRYYLNLRYRLRKMTLECRWSQSIYRNQDTISSGNEEISGNTKSEIKFQLRYILE